MRPFQDDYFVGRKQEIADLHTMATHPKPSIAVVYGRRRIGKTALITKTLDEQTYISIEGTEHLSDREQKKRFCIQVEENIGISIKHVPTTWYELFQLITPSLQKNPQVVVFDEFQWLANYRKDIVGDLKLVWDRHWSKISGVNLILCGSIASFMKDKVIKSNALYGRVETVIHLQALKLRETQHLLGCGIEEATTAYLLTGGIPQYLALLTRYNSVHLAMDALAFQKNGYFTNEYHRIFSSHFGRNPELEKIVRFLGRHGYGVRRAKLAATKNISDGGRLTQHLDNLEAAGFITKVLPFNAKAKSTLLRYELTDAYLRFYFDFIEPNENLINSNSSSTLFSTRIAKSPTYRAWLGRSFEYLCRYHAEEIAESLGFAAVDYTHGPFFKRSNKATEGVQLDLVFSRADNVLVVCEMKYRQRPIGKEVIQELTRKELVLQKIFPTKTIQPALISAFGATSGVIDTLGEKQVVTLKNFGTTYR